ncbi:hypothetical protein E2C01_068299 [Portunus trituberculatus]|uniref:Uncharacterized protein n=1 Tax=Portunus trituberculatus TaxID=210409 RepID=A0A5B7HW46_PORTR|nr:hypothetical protein [Portunus trituberculatus]
MRRARSKPPRPPLFCLPSTIPHSHDTQLLKQRTSRQRILESMDKFWSPVQSTDEY